MATTIVLQIIFLESFLSGSLLHWRWGILKTPLMSHEELCKSGNNYGTQSQIFKLCEKSCTKHIADIFSAIKTATIM